MSGAVMMDQIATVERDYGRPVVDAALAKLDPAEREDLAAATTLSWLDVDVVRRFKTGVADELGMAPLDLQRLLVRKAIGQTVHKLWRILLRQLWDAAIVKRTPILYSKAFDRGKMTLETIESGRATFLLAGWPDMPEYDCVGLGTGMEALLDISGRPNASVSWKRQPPHGSGLTVAAVHLVQSEFTIGRDPHTVPRPTSERALPVGSSFWANSALGDCMSSSNGE